MSNANARVHRVKDKRRLIRRYRVIPYDELIEILKRDGAAFFEDTKEQPLKRQTVWKAARKLSGILKTNVIAERTILQLKDGKSLEGYSFCVSEKEG